MLSFWWKALKQHSNSLCDIICHSLSLFFFFSPYNPQYCASYTCFGCMCIHFHCIIKLSLSLPRNPWHGYTCARVIVQCFCWFFFIHSNGFKENDNFGKYIEKSQRKVREPEQFGDEALEIKCFTCLFFRHCSECVFEIERERESLAFFPPTLWCAACRNLLLIGNPLLRVFVSNFYWKVKRMISPLNGRCEQDNGSI